MPTLVSICGGAEQAAYAVVWRPELLELEAASSLRESLQAAGRGCHGCGEKNDITELVQLWVDFLLRGRVIFGGGCFDF